MLAEAGIDASGTVVDGDPFAAAHAITSEEDVHEIMLATYPTGQSRWMADDMVNRLRKSSGLGITRVVVRSDEARTPLALPGVSQVAVVADEALGADGLIAALRERADRQPIGVVLLSPMHLEGPGWTDEAEEARTRSFNRLRAAIDGLQAVGVQSRGEVLDGDAAQATTVAVTEHHADEILVVAARGGRLESEESLQSVRAAAGAVPVERIVVDAEAPASPSGS